ncbi:MAG: hypothetical protein COW00_11035 [Bdellovibrio sp. CG12_big_fil_rev_8_21_14_0_65_39_13]|nr:MAG: hypothetical protein COW78_16390 [Bdellovibrio sp. CG22_combo_CG10-13_8_21_14_all_39_27]PIQ59255.1 MAG: hypothetical protein COW00_11035 [Bdellovibrio sp. CG12_big_fil_rev_8_21_14_0_65_39_13]PIR32266.1 MAG: hypothetical protein COV37_20325 [Bdellovibrio sp. CG11_big_fil_rev_8_21_14_0_20_39_38]PJB54052.1 MAG: hypothetical protein CO099_03770 [Bdellovibrio sp. CG_4_9_14_3_um_filter_39_7]
MRNLILFLLFTQSAFASDVQICFETANHYGDGNQFMDIPKDCFETLSDRNAPTVTDEKWSVVGENNLIMIKDLQSTKVTSIAGSYSEIDDIKSMLIDSDRDELYVLSSRGEIKVYWLKLPGNVAPRRIIRNPEGSSIDKMVLDPSKGQLWLYGSSAEELVAINRDANLMMPPEKQKLKILSRHPASQVEELSFDKDSKKINFKTRQGRRMIVED